MVYGDFIVFLTRYLSHTSPPYTTNVKLSKCVENNRKLVKAPIDNYDVKKDRGRMNKN